MHFSGSVESFSMLSSLLLVPRKSSRCSTVCFLPARRSVRSRGSSDVPGWGAQVLDLWRPADGQLCRLRSRIDQTKDEASTPAGARQLLSEFPRVDREVRNESYLWLAAQSSPSDLPELLLSFRRDFGGSLDKVKKKDVLVLFAERSPVTSLRDVVRVTLDMLYDAHLSHPVLRIVARRLPEGEQAACAAEALRQAAADEPTHPHAASVLTLLGPFLPEDLLPKAARTCPPS